MSEYDLYHAERKHKYIKKIGNRYFYTQQEIKAYLEGKKPKSDLTFEKRIYDGPDGKMKDYRLDFNKGKNGWSDGVGVRVGDKKVQVYNTTNKTYEKNPNVKNDDRGRFRRQYAEDGSVYSLDYSGRKKYRQRQRTEVERAKRFSDSLKEWGDDNSEAEADYRSRKAELERAEKRDAARAASKKKVKKMVSKSLKSLKKQAAKGKKKIESVYKPKGTATVVDRIDQRTGEHF